MWARCFEHGDDGGDDGGLGEGGLGEGGLGEANCSPWMDVSFFFFRTCLLGALCCVSIDVGDSLRPGIISTCLV